MVLEIIGQLIIISSIETNGAQTGCVPRVSIETSQTLSKNRDCYRKSYLNSFVQAARQNGMAVDDHISLNNPFRKKY